MDFDAAPDDDPRRRAIRAWLAHHPAPSGRQLAAAGYVAPQWPAPYGLDADPVHQEIIAAELAGAGVVRPADPIGIGWAGPTILLAGTAAQKERYLWPALAGEEIWCQLFSEPDAGSDLAALATAARRDGDEWVVRGSKIWTSGAHRAHLGILLARTDPDVAKHRGISYFVCPMDSPGITVAPIVDMTGAHLFNQVFFDDVRLGAEALVGSPGDGWRLARATLANERVSLSSGGVLWGSGPSAQDLIALVRDAGGCDDALLRQQLARVRAEGEVVRLTRLRGWSARTQGRPPGPEASVLKLLADQHGQRVMALGAALAGTDAMRAGAGPPGRPAGGRTPPAPDRATPDRTAPTPDGTRPTPDRAAGISARAPGEPDLGEGIDPVWYFGSLFSPALTIGGGTGAVQRNIVAERVLGLPAEPDPARGQTWAQARSGAAPDFG